MCMDDVDRVIRDQCVDRANRARERQRVLRLLDDRMRELTAREFRLEFVSADVRVVRLDAGIAQRTHFRERGRRRSRPAVSGGEMENSHVLV